MSIKTVRMAVLTTGIDSAISGMDKLGASKTAVSGETEINVVTPNLDKAIVGMDKLRVSRDELTGGADINVATAGVVEAADAMTRLAASKESAGGVVDVPVTTEGIDKATVGLDGLAATKEKLVTPASIIVKTDGLDSAMAAMTGLSDSKDKLDVPTDIRIRLADVELTEAQLGALSAQIREVTAKGASVRVSLAGSGLAAMTAESDAFAASGARVTTTIKAEAAESDAFAASGARAGATVRAETGANQVFAKSWEATKFALLGVGAAIGYGVYKAAGFSQEMEHIHTQAGVAQSQLAGLGSGVLQLAGQVGQNPDSLAEALYHVTSNMASMGGTSQQELSAVKVAAEGASVGGANLVDVTNALGAAIASGIPGVSNYQSAMGALNATVGAGDMKMQDLAEALGTGFLSNVKIYGSTLNDVGAILATFGDNNIRGAHAGTQLRMSVQSIAVQAASAAPYLKQLGLQVGELGQYQSIHGTVATIGLLVQRLHESGIASTDYGNIVTQLFGKKAGAGIAVLIDQYDRLNSKTKALAVGANTFGAAWKAQGQTTQQQFSDLKDGADALVTSLGIKLLPVALNVMKGLNAFVGVLQRNSAAAGILGGVIGTLLAGIALKKLEDGITGAVEGFEGMWKAGSKAVVWLGQYAARLLGLTAAQEGVTAATEAQTVAQTELDTAEMANPIGLIIIAVAALVIGIYELVKHCSAFRDFWIDAWKDVLHGVQFAWNWVKGNWPLLLGILIGPIGIATVEIIRHWGNIVSGAKSAFSGLKDAFKPFEEAYGWVTGVFDRIKNYVTSSFDSWWAQNGAALKEVWTAIWDAISVVFRIWWKVVVTVAKTEWEIITTITRVYFDILRGIYVVAFDVLKNIWSVSWAVMTTVAKTAWDVITTALRVDWLITETIFDIGWSIITSAWRIGWGILQAIGKTTWDAIAALLKIGWDVIVGIFTVFIDLVTGRWSAAWSTIRTTLHQIWNAISTDLGQSLNNMRNSISNTFNVIIGFFRGVGNRILGALGNLGRLLFNSGVNIINGLFTGLKSVWNSVIGFFKGIPHTILHALGIASPPSWSIGAGKFIMQGITKGLKSGWNSVTGFFSSLAGAIGGTLGSGASGWQNALKTALVIDKAPASWLPALEVLVGKESGGNANAINPITVLGQHASGLMQMLPSTFAANELPGFGNIWNAVDNAVSAIRYIRATYGSPSNIAGLYGGTYVGYDSGGLLMPGFHLVANLTGQPERVIPAGGANSGAVVVNVYCHPSNNPDETARAVWQQLRILRQHMGNKPLGLA